MPDSRRLTRTEAELARDERLIPAAEIRERLDKFVAERLAAANHIDWARGAVLFADMIGAIGLAEARQRLDDVLEAALRRSGRNDRQETGT